MSPGTTPSFPTPPPEDTTTPSLPIVPSLSPRERNLLRNTISPGATSTTASPETVATSPAPTSPTTESAGGFPSIDLGTTINTSPTPPPVDSSVTPTPTAGTNGPAINENLYTSGGEFVLISTGEDYIGFYHIHPDKGPMVGANHIDTPHEYLFSKVDLPNNPNNFSSNGPGAVHGTSSAGTTGAAGTTRITDSNFIDRLRSGRGLSGKDRPLKNIASRVEGVDPSGYGTLKPLKFFIGNPPDEREVTEAEYQEFQSMSAEEAEAKYGGSNSNAFTCETAGASWIIDSRVNNTRAITESEIKSEIRDYLDESNIAPGASPGGSITGTINEDGTARLTGNAGSKVGSLVSGATYPDAVIEIDTNGNVSIGVGRFPNVTPVEQPGFKDQSSATKMATDLPIGEPTLNLVSVKKGTIQSVSPSTVPNSRGQFHVYQVNILVPPGYFNSGETITCFLLGISNDKEGGGDSNGGDSNGGDSNGGDSNGGDSNGGDSNSSGSSSSSSSSSSSESLGFDHDHAGDIPPGKHHHHEHTHGGGNENNNGDKPKRTFCEDPDYPCPPGQICVDGFCEPDPNTETPTLTGGGPRTGVGGPSGPTGETTTTDDPGDYVTNTPTLTGDGPPDVKKLVTCFELENVNINLDIDIDALNETAGLTVEGNPMTLPFVDGTPGIGMSQETADAFNEGIREQVESQMAEERRRKEEQEAGIPTQKVELYVPAEPHFTSGIKLAGKNDGDSSPIKLVNKDRTALNVPTGTEIDQFIKLKVGEDIAVIDDIEPKSIPFTANPGEEIKVTVTILVTGSEDDYTNAGKKFDCDLTVRVEFEEEKKLTCYHDVNTDPEFEDPNADQKIRLFGANPVWDDAEINKLPQLDGVPPPPAGPGVIGDGKPYTDNFPNGIKQSWAFNVAAGTPLEPLIKLNGDGKIISVEPEKAPDGTNDGVWETNVKVVIEVTEGYINTGEELDCTMRVYSGEAPGRVGPPVTTSTTKPPPFGIIMDPCPDECVFPIFDPPNPPRPGRPRFVPRRTLTTPNRTTIPPQPPVGSPPFTTPALTTSTTTTTTTTTITPTTIDPCPPECDLPSFEGKK